MVYGEPVPTPRPRFRNGHVYLPKEGKVAQQKIAVACVPAYTLQDGEWAVIDITFYCAQQKEKDIDNMIKTVLDGMQPHPLPTDSIRWVRFVSAEVVVVENYPHTTVTIYYCERDSVTAARAFRAERSRQALSRAQI